MNFFFSKPFEKSNDYKKQETINHTILKLIYNYWVEHGVDAEGFGGKFQTSSWFRPGDLIPSEHRNDTIYTDFGGISLGYDFITKIYELSIPVKYNREFKYETKDVIEKVYNIIEFKNTGYTAVIKFK